AVGGGQAELRVGMVPGHRTAAPGLVEMTQLEEAILFPAHGFLLALSGCAGQIEDHVPPLAHASCRTSGVRARRHERKPVRETLGIGEIGPGSLASGR